MSLGIDMKKDDYLRRTMDLLAMVLAVVVGLIFAIINLIITQSVLGAWSDLIFHSSCPIGVLFNFNLGGVPFMHAFIIGLPLATLSGCVTAIMASRRIRKPGDALIFGSTTGIMSAVIPYGSAWALYALFSIYWVEQPLLIAYLGLVLLGIAVFVPLAALGAYYCSKEKLTKGSMGPSNEPLMKGSPFSKMMSRFKIFLIVTVILALTIVLPLAIALVGVRLGWGA